MAREKERKSSAKIPIEKAEASEGWKREGKRGIRERKTASLREIWN
ncbi:hypothetical protein CCACVL1_29779 [Corchorus capsularis]|uniref:Uncharacterized protein n=1 Tax=Corchorus capsularis TaxID=210143 RepID=A0A1R3G0G0_COCAP|nr:hypothetical protein CCACVL1_29779 [Corchorus capsularis]